MTRRLKSGNADGIRSQLFGLDGKSDRGALVQHLDTRTFEGCNVFGGIAARGFHVTDAGVDDRLGIGAWFDVEIGKNGQIDAKGFGGEFSSFFGFPFSRRRPRGTCVRRETPTRRRSRPQTPMELARRGACRLE